MIPFNKPYLIGKGKIDYSISLQDTMLIKGVAICCMVWHHLFYEHPEFGKFVFYSSQLGKVCVALFLFISAYGLAVQQEKQFVSWKAWAKPKKVLSFYIKRFCKLYINYWVIFIPFLLLGVFVYHRTLSQAYGTDQILKQFVVDFFGFADVYSYNPTWWFYKLIIQLYVLFPLLYFLVKKWNVVIILIGIVLNYFYYIPIVGSWLLPFVFGISYVLYQKKITYFVNKVPYFITLLLLLISLYGVIYVRSMIIAGTRNDAFFAVIIILLLLATIRKCKPFNVVLQFLGKHSMNIFMTHTFFALFYSDFIYSLHYPILLFLFQILSNLVLSICIEWIKSKLHFDLLYKKIDGALAEKSVTSRSNS